jgi:hypothetical protein
VNGIRLQILADTHFFDGQYSAMIPKNRATLRRRRLLLGIRAKTPHKDKGRQLAASITFASFLFQANDTLRRD